MWRSNLPIKLGVNSLHLLEIKSFCLPLFGIALVNFFHNKGSNLFVGAVLGAEKFALISVSKKGYDVLGQLTITSVNRMIVPSLSRVKPDNRVDRLYDIVRFSSLLITPCYLGLGAVSEEFITIAFGEKYAASAIYLTITTAAISGSIMAWYLPNLLISSGHTSAAFRLKIIGFVRTLGVTAVTVWFGVEVMLVSLTITTYLLLPVSFTIVSQFFSISFRKMLDASLPAIVSSGIMLVTLYASKFLLLENVDVWVRLLALISIGALSYVFCIVVFFRQSLFYVLSAVRSLR